MAKIYLAAKFEARGLLRGFIGPISAMGHTLTSLWMLRDEASGFPAASAARSDLADLDAADLLILDTSFPGGSGREVELGYALARGKRVWKVGPDCNVFHAHPDIRQFEDWSAVLAALRGLEQAPEPDTCQLMLLESAR